MQRVCVIGTSGAGKSTLGRALARSIGAPFCELDSVFHQADWVPLPAEEFRDRVGAVVAGERWVIDGNYSAVRPIASGGRFAGWRGGSSSGTATVSAGATCSPGTRKNP